MCYSRFTHGQMAVVHSLHSEATFCSDSLVLRRKIASSGSFSMNSFICKKEVAKEFLMMTVSEVSSLCNKNKAKEAQPITRNVPLLRY